MWVWRNRFDSRFGLLWLPQFGLDDAILFQLRHFHAYVRVSQHNVISRRSNTGHAVYPCCPSLSLQSLTQLVSASTNSIPPQIFELSPASFLHSAPALTRQFAALPDDVPRNIRHRRQCTRAARPSSSLHRRCIPRHLCLADHRRSEQRREESASPRREKQMTTSWIFRQALCILHHVQTRPSFRRNPSATISTWSRKELR